MYHLLVTTIGGLEGCTNYFHIIGSEHVVWMAREYGNLWRYRNEGVEAFNKIVSLRYNKFNKRGGYNKTRRGQVSRKCDEFWSLGQWLGRWSMWHLGYADSMKHEHLCTGLDDGLSDSGGETDDTYNVADDSDSDSTGYEGLDDDFDLEPVCLSHSHTNPYNCPDWRPVPTATTKVTSMVYGTLLPTMTKVTTQIIFRLSRAM